MTILTTVTIITTPSKDNQAMPQTRIRLLVCLIPCLFLFLCGCTSLPEYVRNGLKVGPNYATPPAPLADDWIDGTDKRRDVEDLSHWWKVFNDPILDDLICT